MNIPWFHWLWLAFFTNGSIDYAIDYINDWQYISRNCCLSKDEFIKLLNLFWTPHISSLIKCYTNYGIPMESSLSPVVSDLVMRNLEPLIRSPPSFYYRYGNDIIIMVLTTLFNSVLNIFNSQRSRMFNLMKVGLR